MNEAAPSNFAPVMRLAERLERDILSRGLLPGDRYLTAAEAGREMGVSAATANRAMRLLAAREVLNRERSRGTFVGPAVTPGNTFLVRTVFVVMRMEDKDYSSSSTAAILEAVRETLGEVNVQFAFVPPHDPISYMQELLTPALRAGHVAALIAVSCQREVYCYLATLRVPLVIFGSLYPNGDPIPSIDADNRGAGRLLARYLVEHGHRRFALLCYRQDQPGEHDFYDGVCEVLAEMSVPATALLVRPYPPARQALRALLSHLVQMPDPPTALILRGGASAGIVAPILQDICVGGPAPEIVCDGYPPSSAYPVPYVHVRPCLSESESARLAGTMLSKLCQGLPADQERIVVPVELCEPTSR